jgi:hypothetical protein
MRIFTNMCKNSLLPEEAMQIVDTANAGSEAKIME